MPKATKKSGLATVQNLYVMQIELAEHLRTGLRTQDQVKEARQKLREYSALLKQADWRYMGGEDVMDTLLTMQKKMSEKIKKGSGTRAVASKTTKTKRTTKKTTTKKKK